MSADHHAITGLLAWRPAIHIPHPKVCLAANRWEATRDQMAALLEHYEEHKRIELIPALGEAVQFSLCPDCLKYAEAVLVHNRDGDRGLETLLLDIFD